MAPRVRSCVLWALSAGVSPAEAAVPRLQGRRQEWRPQADLPLADDQEGDIKLVATVKTSYMIFPICLSNVMLKRALYN